VDRAAGSSPASAITDNANHALRGAGRRDHRDSYQHHFRSRGRLTKPDHAFGRRGPSADVQQQQQRATTRSKTPSASSWRPRPLNERASWAPPGGGTKGCRANQMQAPPADPVSEAPHREKKAGEHEAVDVCDPEELHAARMQVCRQLRDRHVEDGEVHRVDKARQGEDAQPDPFAPTRLHPARAASRLSKEFCQPSR
jgi:hypothetical protein